MSPCPLENPDDGGFPYAREVFEASPLGRTVASGLPGVSEFLERWQNKGVFVRESDGLFFYAEPQGDGYALTDISTLEPAGTASDMTEMRPNGGVRRVIGAALVQFQLSDPDRARRVAALDAIEAAGGAPFYKVRIATEKDFFERHGVIYRLVPGVQVTCSIRTGQRSVLAYLTDPFLGSFQTALRER